MQRPEEMVEMFQALSIEEVESRALHGLSFFFSTSDEHQSKNYPN